MLRKGGDPDADGDPDRHAVQTDRLLLDRPADALRRPQRLAGAPLGEVGQELLAAVARRDIVRPDRLADEPADLGQHVAPHEMTVGVVHRLEMVQVHHQHGEGQSVFAAALQLQIEGQVERFLGEEPGELVVGDAVTHLLVVARLDLVEQDELQDRVADLDLVALRQLHRFDAAVVDQRAVGAAQVGQVEGCAAALAIPLHADADMLAGGEVVENPHIRIQAPPQDRVHPPEPEVTTDFRAFQDDQGGACLAEAPAVEDLPRDGQRAIMGPAGHAARLTPSNRCRHGYDRSPSPDKAPGRRARRASARPGRAPGSRRFRC